MKKFIHSLTLCAVVITVAISMPQVALAAPTPPSGSTNVSTAPITFGTLQGNNGSSLSSCVVNGRTLLVVSGDISGYTDPGGASHVADKLLVVDGMTGAFIWGVRSMNGWVQTTACANGLVYAGGSFTSVNGTNRNRTASFNATTGALGSWYVSSSGVVWSVHPSGSNVYVAGTEITSTTLSGARVWTQQPDCQVRSIVKIGSSVYVGGLFDKIGTVENHGLIKLNANTGTPDAAFKPELRPNSANCNEPVVEPNDHYDGVNPLSLAHDATYNRLISCDGGVFNRVRSVSLTTGAKAWANPIDGDGQICLPVLPYRLFVGFHRTGSRITTPVNNYGAMGMFVSVTNGKQAIWQPSPDFAGTGANRDGRNNGIIGATKFGNRLCVTGAFTSVGGKNAARLACFTVG